MLAIRALHPGADEVGKALSPLGMMACQSLGCGCGNGAKSARGSKARRNGPGRRFVGPIASCLSSGPGGVNALIARIDHVTQEVASATVRRRRLIPTRLRTAA